MHKRMLLLALIACAATQVMAEDAPTDRKVVAFNASVRVEVDATGKPVKVKAPADLPEAIRGYIEKRVASWQYQPAKQNGVPAAAVTFVQVGACALPVREGYRMGLDFKGNGPAIVDAGPWFIPPPQYPTDMQRVGAQGSFKVSYAIQADGSTKVASIEPMDGTSPRHARSFRIALTSWIEGLRYQPEQVNGLPVATEMSFPVDFSLRMGSSKQTYKQELESRALASKECIAASSPTGPLPIAQNSPVKVTPVPAG